MKAKSRFESKLPSTHYLKKKIDELRDAVQESGIHTVSKRINEEYRSTKKREKDERKVIEQIRGSYVRNLEKLANYYDQKIIDISERHQYETQRLEALNAKLQRGEHIDREEYEKIKRENKKLEAKVMDLYQKLDVLQVENTMLHGTVDDLKRERKTMKIEFKECQRELLDYKDRYEKKSCEMKELKKDIELLKRHLADKDKRCSESEYCNNSLENKLRGLRIDLDKMRKSRDDLEN